MFSPSAYSLLILLQILAVHSLATPSSPTNTTDSILYDIYPFIRVYKNGTVQRFIGQDFAPPSTHPTAAVLSKDIKYSQKLNLSARIYIPNNTPQSHKLPLLIYFHGGGFFTESAFSPTYHNYLNSVVFRAKVVAVSVNYRLAPEYLLPLAYQDSWLALQWIFSHCKEPWIRDHADYGRVYLGGDSAGANLAHNMAIRVGLGQLDPIINFKGMFLNCPFFLGKKAVRIARRENANAETLMENLWLYSYPNSSGLNDPLVDPGMNPDLKRVGTDRILVYVAGKDVLRFRGWEYKKALEKSGWNGVVKVVEVANENHVFNLGQPKNPKSIAMLRVFATFLNR